MDLVDFVKQFISKYYPKDHLYLSGVLASLLFIAVILPAGNTEPRQVQISIPVVATPETSEIVIETEAVKAVQNYDFVLVDPAPAPPAIDISPWQSVEVQAGDNL
ncbi:MAG TPA: hypothetical protein QGI39_05555, partial [Gammaproteobacteria bacterium]|nr:hypothetical protein [Gammaproteobacteria bacterium]